MFDKIIAPENLFEAWREFKRGKMKKRDVLAFGLHVEDEILALHEDLKQGSYLHGPYERFIVHDPKRRVIHKASVRDRVLHHAIVRVIEPIFDRGFIHGSWSCRRGKGTHAAIAWFCREAWRLSRNNTRTVWIMKLDIAKYFASVNQDILMRLLERKFADRAALDSIETVVRSFAPGIPLGNVTSQLFANVYLHELDMFVKGTLRIRNYLRYCDDMVFIHTDRQRLTELEVSVAGFVEGHLNLKLHPNKTVFRKYHQGVDVLGRICFPHFSLLRTSSRRRTVRRLTEENASSYSGLLEGTRSFGLRRSIGLCRCSDPFQG